MEKRTKVQTLKNWYVKGNDLCGDMREHAGYKFYCNHITRRRYDGAFQITTPDNTFVLNIQDIDSYFDKAEILKRLRL